MQKLNLPNKLTVLRLLMVPAIVIVMMVSDALWAEIVGVVLFSAASITDMLDGKIARRNHLITDFGKFLDPLADKFMVIGAMTAILYQSMMMEDNKNKIFCTVFAVTLLIVVFRELAVTSIRLVVAGSGVVVPANMLGKTKTCVQIGCVLSCLAERIFYLEIAPLNFLYDWLPLSILTSVATAFFTVWSGVNYINSYWKYLDPEK